MQRPIAIRTMQASEAGCDPEIPVIEAIRQGDPHAMSEFVQRHERWVRGVVFGITGRMDEVDDVAQRVWMQVWREARNLTDGTRWRSWLYRIARNAAMDTGRSRRRSQRLAETLELGRPERTEAPPDAALSSREQEARMLGAIAALPPLYREPFVLKHLEEWSYQEIAELLGMPVDTVETRLVRARRLLREQLRMK
ncbi:MAG: RNA polymerase sigma factor [Phycisphaerae bacterium]|nr:RNA polymerase sigma factor [Phycisphaerae bacterium]